MASKSRARSFRLRELGHFFRIGMDKIIVVGDVGKGVSLRLIEQQPADGTQIVSDTGLCGKGAKELYPQVLPDQGAATHGLRLESATLPMREMRSRSSMHNAATRFRSVSPDCH